MPSDAIDAVLADLARNGVEVAARTSSIVAGGSISRALRLESRRGPLLLKLEPADRLDMFEAEAESLAALRDAQAVAVPAVLANGSAGGHAYLALEWIDFRAKSPAAERRLGSALAAQHRRTADAFGWHRDNYIGSTPQSNARSDDWPSFFRDARLAQQLALARRNGLDGETLARCAELLGSLERLLDAHAPEPSLLHGDLWGGNWGATADGVPYVYDPAVYFGDREADLAMSRLFGGFGPDFYRAYERAWPLAPGWQRRVDLYNLYHLLNHFNLFGGGYALQVAAALRRLGA